MKADHNLKPKAIYKGTIRIMASKERRNGKEGKKGKSDKKTRGKGNINLGRRLTKGISLL